MPARPCVDCDAMTLLSCATCEVAICLTHATAARVPWSTGKQCLHCAEDAVVCQNSETRAGSEEVGDVRGPPCVECGAPGDSECAMCSAVICQEHGAVALNPWTMTEYGKLCPECQKNVATPVCYGGWSESMHSTCIRAGCRRMSTVWKRGNGMELLRELRGFRAYI